MITRLYSQSSLFTHYCTFIIFHTGVLEVFGSWTKVAPHYEGAPFEGELERQLQDAMGEHETSSITIVAKESRIKTGFSPPGP